MGKHHNNKYYKHLRALRLHHDSYQCQNCGILDFSNQVHHKSGNAADTVLFLDKQQVIADLSRLITLCQTCHSYVTRFYK